MIETTAAPIERPRWRGVLHSWALPVALLAGAWLVWAAPSARAAWGAAIFTLGILACFGASATYHRITWGPRGYITMKRLDHAMITALIAGTYTPVCLLTLPPEVGATLLAWVWGGAGLIVVRAVLWPKSPRVVSVLLFVALGWTAAPFWDTIEAAMTSRELWLLAAGGLVYTAGAVMYAAKRPSPVPGVFGYHELFHACTIIACACHFVMVSSLVQRAAL